MLRSPAGPLPRLFLRPPEHSSFQPPTLVLKPMRVGGRFHSQAEGPALMHVGAPVWPIRPLVCLIASDWLQLNSAKAIICP